MKQGQKFSRERVVALKQAMLRGVSDTALARVERVTANTIRRMRLGETYAGVVVAGEDSLRPPLDIVDYVPQGAQTEARVETVAVPFVPDEEVEAMAKRLMAHQEQRAREMPKAGESEALTPEEIKEKARMFGATGAGQA